MRRLRTFEVLELTSRLCLEHALYSPAGCGASQGFARLCKRTDAETRETSWGFGAGLGESALVIQAFKQYSAATYQEVWQ